jgi:sorting nexin-9/18/33
MVYSVTSLFHPDPDADTDEERPLGGHSRSGSTVTVHHGPDTLVRVTVSRRFSHFVALHTALLRSLPGLALPPLPEKQYAGRFSNDFVEARRMELERYLARLVRHPLVRYAGIVTAFLSCDDDTVSIILVYLLDLI